MNSILRHRSSFISAALLATMAVGCAQSVGDEAALTANQADQIGGESSWRLGRGFDTVSNRAGGDCVTYTDYSGAPGTGGQDAEVHFKLLQSSEDMQDAMNVSVSASAQCLVGGGDAKATYASSHKFDSTSVYALISINTVDSPKNLGGVKLTDDAAALLRPTTLGNGDPTAATQARFRQMCGDQFIDSLPTGGDFYALVQYTTTSEQHKSEITAAINAHYMSFSAHATMDTSHDEALKTSQTYIDYWSTGALPTTKCLDVDCVLGQAAAFRSSADSAGKVVGVGLRPYTALALPSDGVSPMDVANAQAFERQVMTQVDIRRDTIASLDDAIQHPSSYVAPNVALWQSAETALNDDVEKLRITVNRCMQDLTTCNTFDFTTMSPIPTLPVRIAPAVTVCTPGAKQPWLRYCERTCSAAGVWVLTDSKCLHQVGGL